MDKPDRVIVWRVTQDCNMRCSFCSYSTEAGRRRNNANSKEIKRLIPILSNYREKSGRNILVSFIGGKPFLYKEIFDLAGMLKEAGISVSTTTNGLLLDSKERRSKILQCFSEIVFSVDGFKDCHDRARLYTGHFDRLIANITSLEAERRESGSKLKIVVNTILMRDNIGQFEELCLFLAGVGVKELTFNQLGGYHRPEFYEYNRLLPRQVEEFCERLPGIQSRLAKKGLTERRQ